MTFCHWKLKSGAQQAKTENWSKNLKSHFHEFKHNSQIWLPIKICFGSIIQFS